MKEYFEHEGNWTTCILKERDREFVGLALCHPEDAQFQNRITGEHIAMSRAYIEYLIYLRNCIVSELRGIKRLYADIAQNKNFNKESFETKTILRTIKKLEIELNTVRSDIKEERENLSNFLKSKNEFYRELEKRRGAE